MLFRAGLAAALFTALPHPVCADTPALSSFTGGQTFTASPLTWGWRFTLGSDILVTQLGVYDEPASSGLGEAHSVGIWDTGGTLVASGTVPSGTGSTLLSSFRYTSITPTLLAAGIYNIGAFYATNADGLASNATTLTMAAGITFNGGQFASNSFANPATAVGGNGYFGPNFQFTPTPEPGSVVLLCSGAALLGAPRRRKTRPTR